MLNYLIYSEHSKFQKFGDQLNAYYYDDYALLIMIIGTRWQMMMRIDILWLIDVCTIFPSK